jgi:D-sedoheptulose 7-phosphate isomerase
MQQANKVSCDNPSTISNFTLQPSVSSSLTFDLKEFSFETPLFSLIIHIICEFFEFHPPKSPEDLALIFSESASVDLLHANDGKFLDKFEEIKSLVVSQISQSGLIVLAGNGGSACDAEEFIFNARSAGALSVLPFADSGALTCIANDWSFKEVFTRQVEAAALARDLQAPRCLFIAISTSGNSPNLLSAVNKAEEHGVLTVFLGGGAGGALLGRSNYSIIASHKSSNRIQESHSALLSLIILYLKTQKFLNK